MSNVTETIRTADGYTPLQRSNPMGPVPVPAAEGGIVGYNPHQPGPVTFVDTSDKSIRTVDVDLSGVDKHTMNELTNGGADIRNAPTSEAGLDAGFQAMQRLAGRVKPAQKTARVVRSPAGAPQPLITYASPPPAYQPDSPKTTVSSPPLAAEMTVVQPPEHRVLFEIQGVGVMEAWYHEVVREGDLILLAIDQRYRGPKYMPPNLADEQCPHCGACWSSSWENRNVEAVCPECGASSPPPRQTRQRYLLVDVVDWPEIFQVASLGLQAPFLNYQLCLLPVLRSSPKEAG